MPRLSAERKDRKPAKQQRLEARVTDEQRALFQRAADLQGRSLTDFVIASVQKEAMMIIETMEILRLNAEESRRMAEAIVTPPEPSAYTSAAAQRYLASIDSR
jgi:uncharacterized protein (DUF1778 family)